MSVTHVHNEVNRLIREYELSNKDVKLLAEKLKDESSMCFWRK